MAEAEAKPATYTVKQAHGRVPVSRNAFCDALRRGEIPAIRIGRRWLVLAEPFDRMLQGEG
jgi:excisionase family DNA binding protein